MAHVLQPRALRNIPELAIPAVFEKGVTTAHRRYEQVRVPIVVDIRKRRRHPHTIPEKNTDLLKLPAPNIPPQLAPAQLTDEKKIQSAITIHIRNGHPCSMIVMHPFETFVGVFHRP